MRRVPKPVVRAGRFGLSHPFMAVYVVLLMGVAIRTVMEILGPQSDAPSSFVVALAEFALIDWVFAQSILLGALALSFFVTVLIGGAGAIPRPSGRGYAPSLSDTFHRYRQGPIFHIKQGL